MIRIVLLWSLFSLYGCSERAASSDDMKQYVMTGEDIDFDSFVAKHKYLGVAVVSKHFDNLQLTLKFQTTNTTIEAAKNREFVLRATLDRNDNLFAGSYVIDDEDVNGFGSVTLKYNKDNDQYTGYTIFHSDLNNTTFGMTNFILTKD